MIVKVIIKREVIEEKKHDFFIHLKNLRFHAMHQNGYISGETLVCAENTKRVVVISKWESLDAWNKWKTNEKRLEIESVLKKFQDKPTVYEPYVFSKFKLAAEMGFPLPLQDQQL